MSSDTARSAETDQCMVLGRINPNETKRYILYNSIQHAKYAKRKAQVAFKYLLTSQEIALERSSKHAEKRPNIFDSIREY